MSLKIYYSDRIEDLAALRAAVGRKLERDTGLAALVFCGEGEWERR